MCVTDEIVKKMKGQKITTAPVMSIVTDKLHSKEENCQC